MQIRTITASEYEAFGKKQENWTFLNSVEHGSFLSKGAWQIEYIGAYEKDQLAAVSMIALLPSLKVFKYAYIPRGFLLDWKNESLIKDFSNALKAYLKKKRVMYLSMNPYLSLQQRDKNGAVVEGGPNHFGARKALMDSGWLHMSDGTNYSGAGDGFWMSVLDIKGKSMDQLLKEMDQQTRWSINRAAKYDLIVRQAQSDEDYEAFQKLMEHTGARNGFDPKSESYYKNFVESYGDKADLLLCFMDIKRFVASQQKIYDESNGQLQQVLEKLEAAPNNKKLLNKKKVLLEAMDLAQKKIEEAYALQKTHGDMILLAGSLFCKTEKELIYLFSGAYDEFFKYNAPYAIHYEEIKKAAESGMDTYNFYGISGNFQKGEEGYSLFDFKRGFGCTVVELLGDYILPVKPVLFSLYKMAKPSMFANE
jgi:peptidoglycan pentaglycine glycine transferase (the second and third glycine)